MSSALPVGSSTVEQWREHSQYLVLKTLRVVRSEEWMGAGQVYITVDGRMVWGVVDIVDDTPQELIGSVEPIHFNCPVSVEIWDINTSNFDSDGRLGGHIVDPDLPSTGREQLIEFCDDGASYRLSFVLTGGH